ncbi:hypothetical protein GBAR_LOCUS20441 [Geodia barretti]|uniref:Uncharacterized protein n=1 Tax=Geodia barretti TaxID=519541 RepID=A0AA35SVI4_GEOBA|nr:hypothetical protein GBAR_LOCUS20441 [Geodia barretti]
MGLRYVGAKATLCCVKSNSSDRSGVFVLSRCLDIGLGQYCDTLSMTRPLSPSVKPDPVCPEGCNDCTEVDGKVSCTTCEDSLELNADDNSCRKKSTGSGGGNGPCGKDNIICIIIPIAILLAIILAVAVAAAVYAYYRWKQAPATKLKGKDPEGINGVARDNPLYLDPTTVAEEVEG